ncbi:hypothetical protein FOA52_007473 [Chlamydomonas sp. UWO 241]|nr:hypothetical protein FOA52_007473 [Chlamydomonas sp. UWO 241]
MKQVAREKARNEILTELLHHIQLRVGFVDDPEGAIKVPTGPAKRRVMINNNEGDVPWASHLAADMRKELALSDERLFESFAKHVFPRWIIDAGGDSMEQSAQYTLGITDPDPTMAMSAERLIDMARGCHVVSMSSFSGLVPAGSPEATDGQLTGDSGARVYCALWGEFYDAE